MLEGRVYSFNIFVYLSSKRRDSQLLLGPRSCKANWSGDAVICSGLLGEGTCSIRTEASLSGGVGSPKSGGMEHVVSKIHSECWHSAGFGRWPCVYAGVGPGSDTCQLHFKDTFSSQDS